MPDPLDASPQSARRPGAEQQTSTLALKNYLPGQLRLSSTDAGWEGLLVRTYVEPHKVDHLFVPVAPDPSIVLVTRGASYIESREAGGRWRSARQRSGHIGLTAAGRTRELRWKTESEGPIETLHLHLSAEVLWKAAAHAADVDPSQVRLRDCLARTDPVIRHICLALKKELEGAAPENSRLYAEEAAHFLAVHLLKTHAQAPRSVEAYAGGLPGFRERRVKEYIQAHLSGRIRLEDLAEEADMSAYHFARLFKESVGLSPHQYVIARRIEESRRLLREKPGWTVARVALEVGYHSASHFARLFRERTGCSPSTFRKGV